MNLNCIFFLVALKNVYLAETKSENANVPSRSACLGSSLCLNEWCWKGQTPYSRSSHFLEEKLRLKTQFGLLPMISNVYEMIVV